jgi:hypothetical protein
LKRYYVIIFKGLEMVKETVYLDAIKIEYGY